MYYVDCKYYGTNARHGDKGSTEALISNVGKTHRIKCHVLLTLKNAAN